MVTPETAGEPNSGQKWMRSSLRQLSRRLAQIGHPASPPTVSRLLKKLDYSLKANVKKEAGKDHPDRDKIINLFNQGVELVVLSYDLGLISSP